MKAEILHFIICFLYYRDLKIKKKIGKSQLYWNVIALHLSFVAEYQSLFSLTRTSSVAQGPLSLFPK